MRYATLHSYIVGNPLKASGVSGTLNQSFFSGNFFDGNSHMFFILGQKLLKVIIFWEEKTEITIFRQQVEYVAENVVGVLNFSNVLL